MKPIDKLHLGPTRKVEYDRDQDRYIITITAPNFVNPTGKSVTVVLTPLEFTGYLQWQSGWQNGALIQDALPHLPASEREKILTGLDDDMFYQATKE